ncbi:hypothetical protein T1E_4076 [Pseudomonas putida DOT-T1E]|uniref:Uncharacterized protein n=1 Tax=Pseudomonas putida (strain DOT-T1E) TaxID=1196325 RepID=I7B4A0_PSEPT|nr:hypothetical protein T1E_4076 [Pseudomonas putida DOT-T1E]
MQGLGQGFALGLTLRQDAAQHLAYAVANPAFGEACQVLAGKPVVQHRHGLVRGRQRRLHVGPLEHQCIMWGAEHQRRMERHLVRLDILRLRPLHQYPPRLDRPATEPFAQRQRTGQRRFGAVPGWRQVVTVHGQNQRITLGTEDETEVGAFGDDALVAHQALEALGQGAAGHQRIAHHMERRRADHPCHVQADGLIARQLHRQLPEAGHGVLRKTCIGVVEGGKVQPQLLEHGSAIQPFQFKCLHDP